MPPPSVTCASPRNDSEKQSWWMSGVKHCLYFFVLYRNKAGADVRLGKVACRRCEVPRFLAWLFHNVSPCLDVGVSCRGEEDRGEEVKKLLNAWSPRRSPLQVHETRVEVSAGECRMTRRSLNHQFWAEGWAVERILYARDPQSGDRKVDVVSFFACMQL